MNPVAFLDSLKARGIAVKANGGAIAARPVSRLTETDREVLVANKAALLELLATPAPYHTASLPPARYPAPETQTSTEWAGLVPWVAERAAEYATLCSWRAASAEAAERCTGNARLEAARRAAEYDRRIAAAMAKAGAWRDGDGVLFPLAPADPSARDVSAGECGSPDTASRVLAWVSGEWHPATLVTTWHDTPDTPTAGDVEGWHLVRLDGATHETVVPPNRVEPRPEGDCL